MVELKNDILNVKIKERGAELSSVMRGGREYIWQGLEAFWKKQCPIMFPVCGRLNDKKYVYDGKTYFMENHGFAQTKEFSAEKISDTEAVFTLKEDEETLAQYPFPFVFRVRFSLEADTLTIRNEVFNPAKTPMYFNFGSHEAYSVDGKFTDWSVVFEKKEDLFLKEQPILGYLGKGSVPFRKDVMELALSHKLFENDALVFDKISSRSVTLCKKGDPVVQVSFPGFENLLLWTKVGAPYLCIEPWNGLPDYVDASGNLEEKRGIIKLDGGENFAMTHSVKFFEL